MKNKDITLIYHGMGCIAVIERMGYGDQQKIHEYMCENESSTDGIYFDNPGYDKTRYDSRDHLEHALKLRYPTARVMEYDLKGRLTRDTGKGA